MSILTRWLLIPPVNARLIGRYRDYRRHGASALSATLGCFWMILAWIFIPLEHPRVGFKRDARLFLDDPGLDFYSAGAPALAAYSRRT